MRQRRGRLVLLSLVVLALIPAFVFSQPNGVNQIERGNSERAPTTSAIAVQAEAGNVTALTINATRVTNRWQGYFGNISGVIELGDAAGNLLYDWDIANPRGEIYAVNDSVVPEWTDVYCFNFSNNPSDNPPIIQAFNGSDLDTAYDIDDGDVDGVDETFNETFTGSFQLGSNTIDADSGCYKTNLYVNSEAQDSQFEEVLLSDNRSIIFAAILEDDQIGFSGAQTDFQLIVAENGNVTEPTDYYFYVELT